MVPYSKSFALKGGWAWTSVWRRVNFNKDYSYLVKGTRESRPMVLSMENIRGDPWLFNGHSTLSLPISSGYPTSPHPDSLRSPFNLVFICAFRSVPANSYDQIYCMQLAQNAVHGAMAGYTAFSVGMVNDRVVRETKISQKIRKKKLRSIGTGKQNERLAFVKILLMYCLVYCVFSFDCKEARYTEKNTGRKEMFFVFSDFAGELRYARIHFFFAMGCLRSVSC